MKHLFTFVVCAAMFGGMANAVEPEPLFPRGDGLRLHCWSVDGSMSFPNAAFGQTETPNLFTVYSPAGMEVNGKSGMLITDETKWYKHWDQPVSVTPGSYVDYYEGGNNNQDVFFEGSGTFCCVHAVWNGYGFRASVDERPTCYLTVSGEEKEMVFNGESGLYEVQNVDMKATDDYNVRLKTVYFDSSSEEQTEGYLFTYTASDEVVEANEVMEKTLTANIEAKTAKFGMADAQYNFSFNPVTGVLGILDNGTSGVEDVDSTSLVVIGGNGFITVKGVDAYKVYTLAGNEMIVKGETVELPAGLYLVSTGTKTVKVVVK